MPTENDVRTEYNKLKVPGISEAGEAGYSVLTVSKWNDLVEKVETRDLEILKVLIVKDEQEGEPKVGVGTQTPNTTLHLKANGGLLSLEGSTRAFIQFYPKGEQNDRKGWIGYADANTEDLRIHNQGTGTLRLTTKGNKGLTIDSSGKVGVGTTPEAKLHVAGDLRVNGKIRGDGELTLAGAYISLRTGATNSGDGQEKVRINQDGKVGIGVTQPSVKLDVAGNVKVSGDLTVGSRTSTDSLVSGTAIINNKLRVNNELRVGNGWSNSSVRAAVVIDKSIKNNDFRRYNYLGPRQDDRTGWFDRANNDPHISLYARQRIVSSEFMAKSDVRSKEIIGLSNSTSDLAILNQIQVTDYVFRDKITLGNRPQKKIIGQQIAQVYPQAVTADIPEFVPDIMELIHVEDGAFDRSDRYELATGERLKFITQDGEVAATISEVTAKQVVLDQPISGEVILYGRLVDDFHVVDYEAIAMLNVSATQELYRRLIALELTLLGEKTPQANQA